MLAYMKQSSAKALTIIITIGLIFGFVSVTASAVSIRLDAPSSVNQGDEFTITVRNNPSTGVSDYEAIIRFDSSKLSYVGYEDRIGAGNNAHVEQLSSNEYILVAFRGDTVQTDELFRMTFRANATGTAEFGIREAYFSGAEGDGIALPIDRIGSVSIQEPPSGNNRLRSLSISPGSLSPSFDAGTTTYTADVGMDTTSVNVDARTEDADASVSISGRSDLSYGSNEVRVVVTAANGSTRTYTINVRRAAPTPTPEATPTPEPTPTPTPTPVPPAQIRLPDGSTYTVTDLPEGYDLPEGFYRTVIEIDGQTVTAFKALRGELLLLYLTDAQGREGFMVYDEEREQIYSYIVMTMPAFSYTFVMPPDDLEVPEGFIPTTFEFNEQELPAWQQDPEIFGDVPRQVYLVYLMDRNGDLGFFLYNVETGRFTPYPFEDLAVIEVEETEVEEEPEEEEEASTVPWMYIAILLGVICLILIGLMIWLVLKNRKGSGPDGGGPDDDEYGQPYDGDEFDDFGPEGNDDLDDGDSDDSDSDDSGPKPPPPPPIPPVRRVD